MAKGMIDHFTVKKIEDTEDISVIQGTKQSSFMYSVFMMEGVNPRKLMQNSEVTQKILHLKINKIQNMNHEIMQFVDDKSNPISAQSKNTQRILLTQQTLYEPQKNIHHNRKA